MCVCVYVFSLYVYCVHVCESISLFQTPFTFDHRPLERVKECSRMEMPRTKASLLDFHANENRAKQEVYGGVTVVSVCSRKLLGVKTFTNLWPSTKLFLQIYM